ncbi:zinc finger BED domain-containing protein 5-like [Panulirus ornatus]|uniref:zinc finger BED domain-containing protein 5-like n=1 Tax=Panulirus ornatus TaxID=150431 RepID=UPI003A8954A4
MLWCLYELREEKTFLEAEEKQCLTTFNFDEVNFSLAYLADVYQVLNDLNLKLQGKDTTMVGLCDAIITFIGKLQLWRFGIQNTTCSPRLDEVVKEKKYFSDKIRTETEDHCERLTTNFITIFSTLATAVLNLTLPGNSIL